MGSNGVTISTIGVDIALESCLNGMDLCGIKVPPTSTPTSTPTSSSCTRAQTCCALTVDQIASIPPPLVGTAPADAPDVTAVGVGVNSALQCGWGWGELRFRERFAAEASETLACKISVTGR